MIRLARLYAEKLNEPHKAFDLAKQAHSLTGDPHASALLGELAFRSGDYPWAWSLLEDAAPGISDQPSLSYHLALARYAVGRTADAEVAMQKFARQPDASPYADQARQFLAMLAAARDPLVAQVSADQVRQILAKDPNDVPALMVSALLAERGHDVDKAVQIYQQVLSVYPAFAPAMRQLAILYSQRPGDMNKAYDLARKARENLPDDLELARILGVVAFNRADYKDSISWLKEYTDKSGEDGEAYYYLGMDYFKQNQTNQCRQALTNALSFHVPKILADNAQDILNQLNERR
jgi:tetratricopeptide (TPR) repeat protein